MQYFSKLYINLVARPWSSSIDLNSSELLQLAQVTRPLVIEGKLTLK